MKIRYEDYREQILKLSWTWSFYSPFSQETLFAEGNLQFAKCLLNFNPEKAKFTTYLHICITGRYKDMIKCQSIIDKSKISISEDIEIESFEKEYEIKDLYHNLSKEAKDIVNTLLNGPSEVIDGLVSPVRKVFNKRHVSRYINSVFGRTKGREVRNELKNFVENLK